MSDTTIPVSKSPVQNQAVKAAFSQNQVDAPKPVLSTIKVKLPSQGYFYGANHPLSSGTIDIYEVTARHEDILSNSALLKKGTVLDEFLKALIATPGVSISDFLIGDKNSLFVAARQSAYGDVYTTTVKCPECGEESQVDINLSKVTAKKFDFSNLTQNENRLQFTLPNSNKVLTFSLVTHKDEADIDAELKALAKFGGGNGTAPEITTRLKYAIKSINGDSDRLKIKNFVDNELTAKDSLALRRHIKENTPDLDMNFEFTCPKCEYQGKMGIPLGANFFWPNISET